MYINVAIFSVTLERSKVCNDRQYAQRTAYRVPRTDTHRVLAHMGESSASRRSQRHHVLSVAGEIQQLSVEEGLYKSDAFQQGYGHIQLKIR
jgi:hypothetical protein